MASSVSLSCVGQIYKEFEAAKTIQRAWRSIPKDKVAGLKTSFEINRIEAIRSTWGDNVVSEIKRLMALDIGLKPDTGLKIIQAIQDDFKKLEKVKKALGLECSPKNQEKFIQIQQNNLSFTVLIGRVLQIKRPYEGSYYIFTHGQPMGFSLINQCMQDLIRLRTPDLYHPLIVPFRLPESVPACKNIDDFSKKYNLNSDDFNDEKHSLELLSVNGNLWNITCGE